MYKIVNIIFLFSLLPIGVLKVFNYPSNIIDDESQSSATPSITPSIYEIQSYQEKLEVEESFSNGSRDENLKDQFNNEQTQTNLGRYSENSILVKFKPNASQNEIMAFTQNKDFTYIDHFPNVNITIYEVPPGKVDNIVYELNQSEKVEYAEPNYPASAFDILPNDQYYSLQYAYNNINAPLAWELTVGADDIIIAVLDTGVDLDHTDLSSKILPGFDFVNNDFDPDDDHGHGTHVSGIAAADTNNSIGIAGVSWGAKILPIKVLDENGDGNYALLIAGINWAISQGADIINMSLGGSDFSQALEDAVEYAYNNGVIVIASAGNDGNSSLLYPASYDTVISVASTDSSNAHSSFSNHNTAVDISAPGSWIYSTTIDGYGYKSGTSMAAPYVSGLASLLLSLPVTDSYSGSMRSEQIWEMIRKTALDLGVSGKDDYYGYGLIQMDQALSYSCFALSLSTVEDNAGSISLDPQPNCFLSTRYLPGTSVSVTAIPSSEYYRFQVWQGDITGEVPNNSVTMDSNKSITAIFETSTFSDVGFLNPNWSYIETLYSNGYTAGCNADPLMFCPDTVMDRGMAAVFMLRGQYGESYTPANPTGIFGDNWSAGPWAQKWSEAMYNEGLSSGCSSNPLMYCPWTQLNRQEASVFGLRMKHGMTYTPPAASGTLFADMTNTGFWGTKWAEQAYLDGLLPACGWQDGKPMFCPEELVDRGWGAYLVVTAKDLLP